MKAYIPRQLFHPIVVPYGNMSIKSIGIPTCKIFDVLLFRKNVRSLLSILGKKSFLTSSEYLLILHCPVIYERELGQEVASI